MRMNRSGRVNLVLLGLVFIAVAAGLLFFIGGDTPASNAGRFLNALGTDDRKTLTDLSYMGDQSPAETRKQWDQTMDTTRHFLFAWRIESDSEHGNNGIVKIGFVKDPMSKGAFEEEFEIPMVKADGKWKVDVRQISRDMYPALPR